MISSTVGARSRACCLRSIFPDLGYLGRPSVGYRDDGAWELVSKEGSAGTHTHPPLCPLSLVGFGGAFFASEITRPGASQRLASGRPTASAGAASRTERSAGCARPE